MKLSPYVVVTAIILILIMGFLFFPSLMPRSDLQLAQYVFKGMTQGKVEVAQLIAWEQFNALGADVGVQFVQLQDNNSRLSYQEGLIRNFAASLIQSGVSYADYYDWRHYMDDAGNAVIAADFPKQDQIVLFEIARVAGRRKLVSIAWGKDAPVKE